VGATLALLGSVGNTGTIDINAGAKLELGGGATGAGTIAFNGAGATLQIDGTTMPSNTISGFARGDSIDLRALSGGTAATFSGGVLSVSNGATVDTLNL